jgi:hypothetical protein
LPNPDCHHPNQHRPGANVLLQWQSAGPDFKACLKGVVTWGVQALERAVPGLTCTMAVRNCWDDGIKVNPGWKETLESTRLDGVALTH